MKKPGKIQRINTEKEYCKKVAFGTKKDADFYIGKIKKESTREKVPARSYLCYKCKCWHLTSWELPDVEYLIMQLNKEIEELNRSIEREYEHEVRLMSIATNELVQLRKDYKKLEFENRILILSNQK